MNKKIVVKQGFTVSELVIVMAIIGILATVTMPVLMNILPDENMMRFKKAYYLTERVVAELVNDEDLYPENDDPDGQQFFGNTTKVTVRGENYEGATKFCELFASKMNKTTITSCEQKEFTDGVNPVGTFTTSDGITWILPISQFDDPTITYEIRIDTNGDKKHNCTYNAVTCKEPDRFSILLYQDGRIELDGDIEKEYMKRSDISKKRPKYEGTGNN